MESARHATEESPSSLACTGLIRLDVSGFRNHAASRLQPAAPFVVITGPNGAGKTNLLEAVSLLAPGRGLRRAVLSDMARAPGEGGWAVAARLDGLQGEVLIGMRWQPAAAGDMARRDIMIDGKRASSAAKIADHLRVSWLTPAMDGLFTGPASARRRFLDRLTTALSPEHAAHVSTLERLLRQRNRLLAEPGDQGRWLDAVEALLAAQAVVVAAARLDTLQALKGGMAQVEATAGAFPAARLALSGWVEDRLATEPAVLVEDAYQSHLAHSRARDAAAGRTLDGAHRSDLEVVHAPKDMPARLCSTGEQKALLIALILAHAHAVGHACGGRPPVLLLDEVAAHLDEHRRAGLFAALRCLGGQVWMTGTDAGLFSAIANDAWFVHVNDGAISTME